MAWRRLVVAMATLMALSAACSEDTPTPSPTTAPEPTPSPPTATRTPIPTPSPTATPKPTPVPTATRTPTPTATPSVSSRGEDVTPEQLAGVLLTQEEVYVEFPNLVFNAEGSGPINNAQAAANSVDPDDGVLDIIEAGRLTGYIREFQGFLPLSEGAQTAPLLGRSEVEVFEDPASADLFLQNFVQELERFEGVAVNGAVTTAIEHLTAAALGEKAVALRADVEDLDFGFKGTFHIVAWLRGPILASVGIVSPQGADHAEAANRLARRMDLRIDEVFSGQLDVSSPPTPAGSNGGLTEQKSMLDYGPCSIWMVGLSDEGI